MQRSLGEIKDYKDGSEITFIKGEVPVEFRLPAGRSYAAMDC
jgi:hypothetical protein